jgi:hypothetical protein
MTLEQWDAMFEAQQGSCAICGEHQDNLKRRLAVDHDHETGKIRALLCQHCNQGLGHFRDNPARLINAASYLSKHA